MDKMVNSIVGLFKDYGVEYTETAVTKIIKTSREAKESIVEFLGSEFIELKIDGSDVLEPLETIGNTVSWGIHAKFVVFGITDRELANNKLAHDINVTHKGIEYKYYKGIKITKIINQLYVGGIFTKTVQFAIEEYLRVFVKKTSEPVTLRISCAPDDILSSSCYTTWWSSCHSVRPGKLYAAGNFSYLNDKHTAIAYVYKDTTNGVPQKMWRQLLHINPNTETVLGFKEYDSSKGFYEKGLLNFFKSKFPNSKEISTDGCTKLFKKDKNTKHFSYTDPLKFVLTPWFDYSLYDQMKIGGVPICPKCGELRDDVVAATPLCMKCDEDDDWCRPVTQLDHNPFVVEENELVNDDGYDDGFCNCGNEHEADANFCTVCGRPINEAGMLRAQEMLRARRMGELEIAVSELIVDDELRTRILGDSLPVADVIDPFSTDMFADVRRSMQEEDRIEDELISGMERMINVESPSDYALRILRRDFQEDEAVRIFNNIRREIDDDLPTDDTGVLDSIMHSDSTSTNRQYSFREEGDIHNTAPVMVCCLCAEVFSNPTTTICPNGCGNQLMDYELMPF